jgi:membrane-associated phospholipid phosphatase
MVGLSRTILKQRPSDLVTIIFLLFLISLAVIFYRVIPTDTSIIGLYSVLIAAQIVLINIKSKGNFVRVLYEIVFPVLCVLFIFDSLGSIVHYVNPKDIDPVLIKLDYMIFGGHPTVMLERIVTPVLTDLLQLAYTTYYFITVSFGVLLFIRHQRKELDKSVFMILLCFYLSYLGYILFPALGPRFYLKTMQTIPLKGFLIADPIKNFLNWLEGIKRDAFPSGHTAVTVLVLYLAYRFEKRFFWVCLPVVIALIFATVYCRYHYVVDVIAGLVLTLLTIFLGEWYYEWWSKNTKNHLR